MLKELFESVKTLAQQAAVTSRPELVADTGIPNVYGLRNAAGELELERMPPESRDHKASDLTAIVGRVADFARADVNESNAVIWYCRTAVVLLMDDEDRRDTVTLDLSPSPQMSWLQSLEGARKPFPQRELILTLRTLMRPCLGPAGNIIDVLRKVNFTVQQEGAGVVQHGKSSVGKSMRAEISGALEIPEYVTFEVPVFESGFQWNSLIECALEPTAETQTFTLIPIPGQIEKAFAAAEYAIGERLRAETKEHSTPVYFGQP